MESLSSMHALPNYRSLSEYVCMYVCMYACMYARMYVCMYVCTSTFFCDCMHAHTPHTSQEVVTGLLMTPSAYAARTLFLAIHSSVPDLPTIIEVNMLLVATCNIRINLRINLLYFINPSSISYDSSWLIFALSDHMHMHQQWDTCDRGGVFEDVWWESGGCHCWCVSRSSQALAWSPAQGVCCGEHDYLNQSFTWFCSSILPLKSRYPFWLNELKLLLLQGNRDPADKPVDLALVWLMACCHEVWWEREM